MLRRMTARAAALRIDAAQRVVPRRSRKSRYRRSHSASGAARMLQSVPAERRAVEVHIGTGHAARVPQRSGPDRRPAPLLTRTRVGGENGLPPRAGAEAARPRLRCTHGIARSDRPESSGVTHAPADIVVASRRGRDPRWRAPERLLCVEGPFVAPHDDPPRAGQDTDGISSGGDRAAAPLPGALDTTIRLLERIREGDAAARETLIQRYLPPLRRWAHGRLPA